MQGQTKGQVFKRLKSGLANIFSPISSGPEVEKSRLQWNIVFNYGGTVWVTVINLVFVPIYIEFMGMAAFGLVGFSRSLEAILIFLDFGLRTTVHRHLAKLSATNESQDEIIDFIHTLEIIYWAAACVILLTIVSLNQLLANNWLTSTTLSAETVGEAICLMGLVLAMRWPQVLYTGGLIGLERQVLLNIILCSGALFRAVLIILGLWLIAPTIRIFFLCSLIASGIQTLASRLILWRALPRGSRKPSFRANLLMSIWKFSAGMFAISITTTIVLQMDKIALSKIAPLETLGEYTLAWTISFMLLSLAAPIQRAILPRFTKLFTTDDSMGLINTYHKSSQLLSVLLLPTSALMVFFSERLLYIWTGDHAIAANVSPLLSLLAIGAALLSLSRMPYALQLSHGWTGLALGLNLFLIILGLPILIYMINDFGAKGATYVWIGMNAIYFVITVTIMHSRILKSEKVPYLLHDILIPTLAALSVTAVFHAFAPAMLDRILSFLYVCLVMVISVIITAFASRNIRGMMAQFIPGGSY